MDTKICKRCDPPKEKPLTEFYKRKASKDGHSSICKECESKHHRTYYVKKRIRITHRKSKLKINYNMTITEFNDMYEEQEGGCAICRVKSQKLVVDHDHRTGKKRRLLCSGCNHGLGRFKDNPVLLRRAAEYVEYHGQN